jgi:UDP-N-acetylglucosamine acyltransferase
MSNNATLGGHVEVGDFAIFGGLSAVHQFCRIGSHAFLGGASAIGQDLPPFMLASGHRAKVIGPNVVGLRRRGTSQELMQALKTAYRLTWNADLPRKEALEQLEQTYANLPELLDFVGFVRGSERGIAAAGRNSDEM